MPPGCSPTLPESQGEVGHGVGVLAAVLGCAVIAELTSRAGGAELSVGVKTQPGF